MRTEGSEAVRGPRARRAMTIGAVCKALSQEFPDISISKIRYLEDQKLLTPRRTPGGYRLYSPSDVARLRTILRLQRDEFLPLRVIRQELRRPGRRGRGSRRSRVRRAVPPSTPARRGVPQRCRFATAAPCTRSTTSLEETRADPKLVRELEEYGVIRGELRAGVSYYDETEREIVRAVTELARYGVAGRNLRVFRTSADREAALLQQILAPALRSRNPDRRKEAIDDAREPRRGDDPPEAPAADPRPAEDRRLPSACPTSIFARTSATSPTSRSRGSSSRTSRRCCSTRRRSTPRSLGLAAWARPLDVDLVVAAEARGFILGAALARELGAGFVPARKPGKLPSQTVSAEYVLEYGIDALEVHADALARGARVLVHDDLLATGGTARALCDIVSSLGGAVVGCAFLIELAFLGGREPLAPFPVHALVDYAAE